MKCPMSFNNPDILLGWADCDPECAWLMSLGERSFCAVVALAVADMAEADLVVSVATMQAVETKEAKNDAAS